MSNDPFENMPVNQPGGTADQLGGDGLVHRQKRIDDGQMVQRMADPFLPPIIQGSTEIFTTRQQTGTQHFLSDNTLIADHRAEDGTFFSDLPVIGSDQKMPAPRVAHVPRDSFDAAAAPAVGGVTQSDQPLPGQEEAAPVVISKAQIDAALAAKKKGGR